MTNTSAIIYAVATIETVYGTGVTPNGAIADASRWLEEAGIAHDDDALDVYVITVEQAEAIASGNVDVRSLGIDTRAQSHTCRDGADEGREGRRIETPWIDVHGERYDVTVEGNHVSISRDNGGKSEWIGTGSWTPERGIEDCSADLGDDVYEALNAAIDHALDAESLDD